MNLMESSDCLEKQSDREGAGKDPLLQASKGYSKAEPVG